ncbi:MAG: UDP-N-acetylglucosamine--N-acetylmuramyl-(pentapeptide) pyrophosphoryl-undecaprenol N-acetylglucosamine transferase [Candidatus Paceibacteria bacterium]|jgi:UDP-N-acetylglucosamine--N-acetylmuramyl-(pentapeptide) pyrophosphoryl-undecaprenol N-acetylglucosamine transferase
MKIVFTGGVTGGHFYPIIAVAEAVTELVREKKLVNPKMYFVAPGQYNSGLLSDHNIEYRYVTSGKKRKYFSLLNFVDLFKIIIGIFQAIWVIFRIYPDVIFSKGGYGSIPTVIAGKILHIPIIIHESDSKPGKANLWAGKFANKIAVSYPEAAEFFIKERVAFTGNPIRKAVQIPTPEGGAKFFELEEDVPIILVIGGSQGAGAINDAIIDILSDVVKKYQVIHQTGQNNFEQVTKVSDMKLELSEFKDRYKPVKYLNDVGVKMAAGACSLVITRAGSSLFEIALWGKPSIIIPIPEDVSHDQRTNAFNYARSGAGVVIEQHNATPEILMGEITRIFENEDYRNNMIENAKKFAVPDAGRKIAVEIIKTALKHEE